MLYNHCVCDKYKLINLPSSHTDINVNIRNNAQKCTLILLQYSFGKGCFTTIAKNKEHEF